MTKIDLGKVAPTYRGSYETDVTYNELDVVEFNGSSYIARQYVTGVTPGTDDTSWGLIANQGPKGDKGDKGDPGDPGGTLLTEVTEARNGKSNLKTRLDKEHAQVTEQLAHIAIDATIFGAKGDGETDDTAAIQSAIDFLENQRVGSHGGGTVLLPDGEFKTTNLLVKSNIILRGSGYSSILKLSVDPKNWKSPIILGGQNCVSENVLIENMVIDGNHPTGEFVSEIQQSHGIALEQNSKNIRINNVKFRNTAGDGVWLASKDGSGVFPENIAITGCSFENIGRQDIALVHGHDIIISGNRGTGRLDIEPVAPAGGVTRVSVMNNIFDSISIMNYSYQRSEFVVHGNVATYFLVWELGGLSFVGNSCFGKLRISKVKKAIFSDNLIKCLEIRPTTTSFNEDIIISKNIIDNIDNGTDDPQNIPVSSTPSTIYIWRTKRMKFVDNIINSPSLTAIFVTYPCEDIEIRGNKLMDDVSTAETHGIKIQSHSSSKNINVIDNEITGFSIGVYTKGASKLSGLKVKRNRIEARTMNYAINTASEVIIEGNELIGSATNYFYMVDYLIHEFNKYGNTQNVTDFIDIFKCTNIKSRFNDYETVNAELIRVYDSPSFFINERLTTTGLVTTGATTILRGSRYETGESTRLGTVYNGTEWVDWSF